MKTIVTSYPLPHIGYLEIRKYGKTKSFQIVIKGEAEDIHKTHVQNLLQAFEYILKDIK